MTPCTGLLLSGCETQQVTRWSPHSNGGMAECPPHGEWNTGELPHIWAVPSKEQEPHTWWAPLELVPESVRFSGFDSWLVTLSIQTTVRPLMAVSVLNTHRLLSLVPKQAGVTTIYRALTMVGKSSPEMRGHMGDVCSHINASVFQIGISSICGFCPRGSYS